MRKMAEFAAAMEPSELPFTTTIGPHRPHWAIRELRRPVQPFHSLWREAVSAFGFDTTRWQRRRKSRLRGEQLAEAEMLVKRLEQLAWETYPNPDYDEERAKVWDAEHQHKVLTKVEWGTSQPGSRINSEPSTADSPSTPIPSQKDDPAASVSETETASPSLPD